MENPKISFNEKISYALGDAAALKLIARLFDVVTDPNSEYVITDPATPWPWINYLS